MANMASPVVEQKAALRIQLKEKRRALGPEQRLEFSRASQTRLLEQDELRQARSVFCYLSTGAEVSTCDLIDRLLQLKKTVAIPKLSGGTMRAAPFDSWQSLRPGQLGILTPMGDAEWREPIDLCVAPGLGFAPDGHRLGFGKGYYDQWFAAHPEAFKTALCYECQLVDRLPAAPWDAPMDKIITEKRAIVVS